MAMETRVRRSCSGGLAVPLFVMAIGTILLLDNLGLVTVNGVWDLWPLFLVAAGVARLLPKQ